MNEPEPVTAIMTRKKDGEVTTFSGSPEACLAFFIRFAEGSHDDS